MTGYQGSRRCVRLSAGCGGLSGAGSQGLGMRASLLRTVVPKEEKDNEPNTV